MKPSKTQLKSREELKKAQDLSKKRKIDEITGGQDHQKDRKIRKIEEPARTRKIYEEDKRPYSDIISTEKENKKQRQINQEQIISDSIESLQEYIDSRREKQQKELLAFGKNREEKQFLENWYQERYLNREIKIQKVWLQTYKQLKLSRREMDTNDELLSEFNQFIELFWPRYLQYILDICSKKFKRNKIELSEKRLNNIPETGVLQLMNPRIFEDFIYSSLLIETQRAIKYKILIETVKNPKNKHRMSLWIMENVLDEDFSNIYEAITNEIEDGQLWGKEEDQTYLQISTEDWDKQVELSLKYQESFQSYQASLQISRRGSKQQQRNDKQQNSPEKNAHENVILYPIRSQVQGLQVHESQIISQIDRTNLEEKYEIDMRNKLAQLDEVKGQKGKRIAIMREKIMADNELYDEEIEQEEEQPDQNYSDDELKQDQDKEADQDIEGRVGEFGEIYATTSSGEDEIEDENGVVRPKRLFIPRAKQQAYKHGEGQVLRIKQKNPMRFTKGTDPRTIAKLNFMVDDSIACPQYLPLDQDDAKITVNTMLAAINQDHVPLSEHIKKENFYMSFQAFNQAVQADPALIKVEINSKLEQFDQIYGLLKTQKEKEADKKFTQGDFRRFCSIFYYVTRRLLKQTEFLMERERKKRMMPKHLLAAAVLSGILPLSHLPKDQLSKSEMVQLENALSQKSPAKQKQYRPRLPNSQIPQQPRLPPPSQNPNNVNAKVQGQNNRRR